MSVLSSEDWLTAYANEELIGHKNNLKRPSGILFWAPNIYNMEGWEGKFSLQINNEKNMTFTELPT